MLITSLASEEHANDVLLVDNDVFFDIIQIILVNILF